MKTGQRIDNLLADLRGDACAAIRSIVNNDGYSAAQMLAESALIIHKVARVERNLEKLLGRIERILETF